MPNPIEQSKSTSRLKSTARPIPSGFHIEPITSSTLASYRRLITLLLPIRYLDQFYNDSIANTTESSLARVAVWQDVFNGRENLATTQPTPHHARHHFVEKKVIGGIQCRVEVNPSMPSEEFQLYVQTIGVLAPYRQLGIATHLLENIIATVIEHYGNVTSIYAHVWEANVDALEWYVKRGFSVEKQVIDGYYRRLKPSGARVVRRSINVSDHLAARNSNAEIQFSD